MAAHQKGKKSDQPTTPAHSWRDAQVQLLLARVMEAQQELWDCLSQGGPTLPPPPGGHSQLPLLPGFFTLDGHGKLIFTTNQGKSYTAEDLLRDRAQIQINFFVSDAPPVIRSEGQPAVLDGGQPAVPAGGQPAMVSDRPDVLSAINKLVVDHSSGVGVVPAKATCCHL